jgi:glycine C-acetyltransferase
MSRQNFIQILNQEVARIDAAGISKRHETVIEKFTTDPAPQAIIEGQPRRIFNSNDYLGLRFNPALKAAEHQASDLYGTGPGAVRFISGSLAIHRQLEQALAKFHGRDDAMVFSSAFATNMAVLFCLLKGQNKDSAVGDQVLVISDELNHRSIIDGIRIANLAAEQKAIFKHMDATDLERVLSENVGKQQRIIVVTDGVFSMLGEYQNLKALRTVIDKFDDQFPEGVWLIVDDAHGVGAFGSTGRGTEEASGSQADVLIGTLGKAFGADGGYVTASQPVIDYLRESAATYIYSNSISPGTAGAALAAVQLVASEAGQKMIQQLNSNIKQFKQMMLAEGFKFAVDSIHPIQPWFIGDPLQTKALKQELFEQGVLVTNINYPVVPKGKDELRVQISAAHTEADLQAFLVAAKSARDKVRK